MPAPTPITSSPVTSYNIDTNVSNDINALLGGLKWGTTGIGTGGTLYYSFPTSNSTTLWDQSPDAYLFADGYEIFSGFHGLNAAQQSAASSALASWANVADIQMIKVPTETPTAVGDIRFAFTNNGLMEPTDYAYTYNLGPSYGGDIWLNTVQPVASGNRFNPGDNGYETLLHEVGHALGLAHPFEGPNALQDQNLDTFKYTIMSYSSSPLHGDGGNSKFYPTTPMLLDIQAIQYIYGANMHYNTGDNTYIFKGTSTYYQTIWDAGGNDTIQYDSRTNATINLNAGTFSRLGRPILLDDGSTQYDNVAIAYNVTIENAIGGSGNDFIFGNSSNNKLSGREGNDVMSGGAGNDSLDGGSGNDILIGDLGNDTLNGGLGADSLDGGDGDDTFIVDNIGDVVIEAFGEGTDTINSSINFDLSTKGENIENLTLIGLANINATGNNSTNVLIGNAGSNILDGRAGADTMIGGNGNDTYIVDDAGDTVIESNSVSAIGGIDLVKSSIISFTLSDNLENLTLIGNQAAVGIGNALNNVITATDFGSGLLGLEGNDTLIGGLGSDGLNGGAGNDVLLGGGGDDILQGLDGTDKLSGGKGDDQYYVDLKLVNNLTATSIVTLQDTVIENVNEGRDVIFLTNLTGDASGGAIDINRIATSTIILNANFEDIAANDTGLVKLNITGNILNNLIVGNDADNVLTGLAGNDFLTGGLGNDTLDGGMDVDTLIGGQGNDTYIVDIVTSGAAPNSIASLQDTIIEANNTIDGIDTLKLRGSLSLTNFTLFSLTDGLANVENLDVSLTGSTKLNLTGNNADNILIGNSAANTIIGGEGNDTLDGGLGSDILMGGGGNDIYVLNVISDVITGETSGNDTANVAFSASLLDAKFANIENLTLTGLANINATGNELDNTLVGNTRVNVLTGNAGNDTLTGGGGNDILNGGADNDTLNGGIGRDILTGGLGADAFVWSLADKGINAQQNTDKITDFNLADGDKLDLHDLLVGESSSNILNYIDVTTSTTAGIINTEIRISSDGHFASGNYSARSENAHITLVGTNLLTGTNEADLLQNLISNNKLIIDV